MKVDLYVILSLVFTVQAANKSTKKSRYFGDEARLLHKLLRGYEKATRPVENASHTIQVKINLVLNQILNMDEKNQILTTNVWFSQEWTDHKMMWDPAEYNNLTVLRIPPDLFWKPDIVLYNGVDDYGDNVNSQCLAMVHSNGKVFWAPIANLRSTCKIDLTFFPFDDQVCKLKIGSWTYDGHQVDLLNVSDKMDLQQYTVNGGWDLLATRTQRNQIYYPCCDEPYPDVTFTLYLRRRTLYYMLNIVVPCILLSCLALLGFWLPVGTSEKVTLGLTILLTFYVLMLSISDRIPETSEFVPLVGIYVMVIMILTATSVAMCVFVLHVHKLGTINHSVPTWLFRFVGHYLSRLVGMSSLFKKYRTHRKFSTIGRSVANSDCEELKPMFVSTEDLGARYRLIQIEGSGVYILAKEEGAIDKEDKQDINDLHSKTNRENGQYDPHSRRGEKGGKVLKPMRAIIVKNEEEQNTPHPDANSNTIIWRDIADVIDRICFWFCFISTLISTLALLIVVPLMKPHLDIH